MPQAIGGAVALVNVQVDDERAADLSRPLQRQGRDRDVVEDAEAGARRALPVVAASRGRAGEAVPEGKPGGEERAAGRVLRAAGHAGIDRQADAPLDVRRHGGGQDRLDIGSVMRERDHVGRSRFRDREPVRGEPRLREARRQAGILPHRKAVPGRRSA
jgi:hypothetical protein